MGARVMCLDSSASRLRRLARAIAEAGWEVWPGNDVRDLLLVGMRLHFEAVVADEASTQMFPELWEQAEEVFPEIPLLVHSANGERMPGSPKRTTALSAGEPDMILAMLILLLQAGPLHQRKAA